MICNADWTFPISYTTTSYMALGDLWIDGYGTTHLTKYISKVNLTSEARIICFRSGLFAVGY